VFVSGMGHTQPLAALPAPGRASSLARPLAAYMDAPYAGLSRLDDLEGKDCARTFGLSAARSRCPWWE